MSWEEARLGSQPTPLADYIQRTFVAEDETLRRLRQDAASQGLPTIHIQPHEGAFLRLLTAACQAKTCLEIGTLGGYSGAWIAGGMAEGGKLHSVEVNPEHADVARRNLTRAGLSDQIDVHVGAAIELLPSLARFAPYDLMFLDADKPNYPHYQAWASEHLRPGGLLVAHNAFGYGGRVADDAVADASVEQIRAFNAGLARSGHWITTVFPAGDGLAVGVLRALDGAH